MDVVELPVLQIYTGSLSNLDTLGTIPRLVSSVMISVVK